MTRFVPSGLIAIRDMLDRIGRELYPTEWRGEPELQARPGLVRLEQYEYEKRTPGIVHSGSGSGPSNARWLRPAGSPDDPEYQAEYFARQRYEAARLELRTRVEAGALQAVVIDPWNGQLHEVNRKIWRRNDAERFIDRGEGPYPGTYGEQIGTLYIKIQSAAERRKPEAPESSPLGTIISPAGTVASDQSGAPGAPSSVHLVKVEFQRRREAGEIEVSLAQEAKVLSAWLDTTHPSLRPMKARSIANSIRGIWNAQKEPQK